MSPLRIVGYMVAAYALLVAAMYVLQRQIQYFPARVLPSPGEAGVPDMEVVTLQTEDGLDLVAWYASARPGPRGVTLPTIVYFHGNGGSIAGRGIRVRPFLDAGYGVLLVEYRGYGGNPDRPTEAGLMADGRAALDFLAARRVPPERTVLYGESLGSGVAVRMAAETAIAALVLEAPFSSAVDVGASAYWFLPVRFLMKDRFDSMAHIGRVTAPLFMVHGEADHVVPVRFGRRLFEAAPGRKEAVYLPHAGHNDLPAHGSTRLVLGFLERTFGG
jgi:fermentation-respiration switch protein FrsA (DUF1100 family)